MIKQAIIPLAGLGTRLLPLTSVFAKELLPINGKPGIEYIIDECLDSGIKEIIFVISNKKEMIRKYAKLKCINPLLIVKSLKGKGENPPAVQTCKQCFATFKPQKTCPECGYETPFKTRKLIERGGDLVELKREEVRLRQEEKNQQKQLIGKARSLAELKAVARKLGYKEGWAYKIYQQRQEKHKSNMLDRLNRPQTSLFDWGF